MVSQLFEASHNLVMSLLVIVLQCGKITDNILALHNGVQRVHLPFYQQPQIHILTYRFRVCNTLC